MLGRDETQNYSLTAAFLMSLVLILRKDEQIEQNIR
jgi:hypothetical protein